MQAQSHAFIVKKFQFGAVTAWESESRAAKERQDLHMENVACSHHLLHHFRCVPFFYVCIYLGHLLVDLSIGQWVWNPWLEKVYLFSSFVISPVYKKAHVPIKREEEIFIHLKQWSISLLEKQIESTGPYQPKLSRLCCRANIL